MISALHTVNAAALGKLDVELDEDVLVTGERKEDKRRVAELIALIPGLRPVNAGSLETARFVEALTPLLISVNIRNKSHAGIKLTGLPGRALEVALLSGGTGGAKLARGLLDAVGPAALTVVANTGDDVEVHGVHVSPDPDLVTYWLADAIDERGYGIRDDTWEVMGALERAGRPVWFRLGDADLAMCLIRTELLASGARLTAAHAEVVRGDGRPGARAADVRLARSHPRDDPRAQAAVPGVHDRPARRGTDRSGGPGGDRRRTPHARGA